MGKKTHTIYVYIYKMRIVFYHYNEMEKEINVKKNWKKHTEKQMSYLHVEKRNT